MSSFANKFSSPAKDGLPDGAVGIGARVSTEEMAKGDSIDNQIEACRSFCKNHPDVFGNRDLKIYTDPGHTGTTFDRPGLNSLRADKGKIQIACFLVRDLKRLGRNTKEGLAFLDEMTAANIQIIDIGQPGIDYRTTKGRKIFTDAMSAAESECGIYRDSSIQGQTERARKGLWKGGRLPTVSIWMAEFCSRYRDLQRRCCRKWLRSMRSISLISVFCRNSTRRTTSTGLRLTGHATNAIVLAASPVLIARRM